MMEEEGDTRMNETDEDSAFSPTHLSPAYLLMGREDTCPETAEKWERGTNAWERLTPSSLGQARRGREIIFTQEKGSLYTHAGPKGKCQGLRGPHTPNCPASLLVRRPVRCAPNHFQLVRHPAEDEGYAQLLVDSVFFPVFCAQQSPMWFSTSPRVTWLLETWGEGNAVPGVSLGAYLNESKPSDWNH